MPLNFHCVATLLTQVYLLFLVINPKPLSEKLQTGPQKTCMMLASINMFEYADRQASHLEVNY